MSAHSKPYANIKQITAHLTIRSIYLLMYAYMFLVGDDQEQKGKLSQPGGGMNLLETNPFFVAVREAIEELGYKLFFVLTNRVPQMHYTCFDTREILCLTDLRHPGHRDYNGHPVTLRFNFEVMEITGNQPEENDPHEMTNPRYERIDRKLRDDKRACFWQALQGLKAFMAPDKIIPVAPDFDAMYNLMIDRNTLNIDPKDAYTWTDHHGTLPYQEIQPFDRYLQIMDEIENNAHASA